MEKAGDSSDPTPGTASFKETSEELLTQLIRKGKAAVDAELTPAVEGVEQSQDVLVGELQALNAEMQRLTARIDSIGVDEVILRRLKESKESLARTKKTLLRVHARLGKLRTFENSDRLRRADPGTEKNASSSH